MRKACIGFALVVCCGVCLPAFAWGDYLTPETWDATSNTFMDGRLRYRDIDIPVAPGMEDTTELTGDLLVGSGENLRDTVVKAPETLSTIYQTGIVGNVVEYQGMVSDNWTYAKLARFDFRDARATYAREGNWGILQSAYYLLKGSCRFVWAVAILNSGEAVYQICKATGQTTYYLLRYPVTGVAEAVAAPVVLVGGAAWSTTASAVTTGWALPLTATVDGVHYAGASLWAE